MVRSTAGSHHYPRFEALGIGLVVALLVTSPLSARSHQRGPGGLLDATTTIGPRPDERIRPDTPAALRIVSAFRAASVCVDGLAAGVVDDFDGRFQPLWLPAGAHEIVLYREGFQTVRHHAFLTPGTSLTIRPGLIPGGADDVGETWLQRESSGCGRPALGRELVREGRVALRVLPASASVRVDGEAWSSSAGGLFLIELPEGSHLVSISMRGHETFSRRLDVREGATTSLRVRLARLTIK